MQVMSSTKGCHSEKDRSQRTDVEEPEAGLERELLAYLAQGWSYKRDQKSCVNKDQDCDLGFGSCGTPTISCCSSGLGLVGCVATHRSLPASLLYLTETVGRETDRKGSPRLPPQDPNPTCPSWQMR